MFHSNSLSKAIIISIALSAFLLSGDASCDVAAQDQGPSLSELFKAVSPSVAIIHTIEKALSLEKPRELTKYAALGSGVLITADGLVVTAAHVVHNAENVMVEFENGDKCLAKVQASSPQADLALLKLEKVPEGACPAVLGDSDKVDVGDDIFIIGAPYGIGHSLTVGYISARHHPNKVVKNFELGEFFQTDAAINTGNSGGPMFNMQGEVVGIVSNILTRSGGFEGVGFAVTSNTARKVLLEEPTPWSGIDFFMLSGDTARAFNIPQPCGALVMRVAVGSLGHNAGLKGGSIQAVLDDEPVLLGGDVILAVQGIEISDKEGTVEKIRKAVSQVPPSGTIRVKVLRGGEVMEIEAPRE